MCWRSRLALSEATDPPHAVTQHELPLPAIELKFIILVCLFVTCMSFINVVSAKLWNFAGLTISGGIMAYWFTFAVTDVVGEVYGRKRALLVVWLGLAANLLVLLLSQIAMHLPAADSYAHQTALETVLGAVPLIVLASLTAYVLAQMHDVWAFDYWKRVTKGRHLWLRNNLSTMTSQLIDSIVFNGIAFYAFASERMSVAAFASMTFGYWLFKVGVAILDTPLVYLLVAWCRADAGRR